MCLFCDIVANKTPAYKVYEDEDTIAILDIFPTTEGHTLIIPKKHYDNYLEAELNSLEKINSTIKLLSKKYIDSLNCKGFNIITNCGSVAGQTINHLHFHLIPRYSENDGFGFKINPYKIKNAEDILNKIKL